MFKKILIILSLFSVLCALCSISNAQESVTITTYYPSPYGSYRQLTADQIAIGSGYRNPVYADGSLYVQGNVGIGTTDPKTKLQINSWGHGIINTVSVPNRTFDIMWYDYGDAVQASPLPPHSDYRWDLSYRAAQTTSVPNGQQELTLMKGTAGGGSAVQVMVWWPDGHVTGPWGALSIPSDARLKKDIVTIPNALEKVLALRGVNFYWKDTKLYDSNLHMGMIGQETEKVVPEVVHTADDELKSKGVQYQYLVALLIEAIKDQWAEIESLTKRVSELEN